MKRNHWLYGEDKRKHQIDKETDCSACIHRKLCNSIFKLELFENFCLNWVCGDSQYIGCSSCSHRFTRYDKDRIPCFICKFFEENKK